MPVLSLNPIQRFRLYQYLETQGKGVGFMLRMQRFYTAFGIAEVEALFERNQETIEKFQADGRPVPRNALEVVRVDDPPSAVEVDEADLEWIVRRTRVWADEQEPPVGKAVEAPMDWRIYLPIMKAIEDAKAAGKK